MATFNYSNSAAGANRSLLKFGAAITLIKSVNVGTSSEPSFTDTEYSIVAAKVNTNDEIDGVKKTRTTFLISPTATQLPEAGDSIRDLDGQTHSIFRMIPVSPAGFPVLYKAYAGQE